MIILHQTPERWAEGWGIWRQWTGRRHQNSSDHLKLAFWNQSSCESSEKTEYFNTHILLIKILSLASAVTLSTLTKNIMDTSLTGYCNKWKWQFHLLNWQVSNIFLFLEWNSWIVKSNNYSVIAASWYHRFHRKKTEVHLAEKTWLKYTSLKYEIKINKIFCPSYSSGNNFLGNRVITLSIHFKIHFITVSPGENCPFHR